MICSLACDEHFKDISSKVVDDKQIFWNLVVNDFPEKGNFIRSLQEVVLENLYNSYFEFKQALEVELVHLQTNYLNMSWLNMSCLDSLCSLMV